MCESALNEEVSKAHSHPQDLSWIYKSEIKSILLTDALYNINSRNLTITVKFIWLRSSSWQNHFLKISIGQCYVISSLSEIARRILYNIWFIRMTIVVKIYGKNKFADFVTEYRHGIWIISKIISKGKKWFHLFQ